MSMLLNSYESAPNRLERLKKRRQADANLKHTHLKAIADCITKHFAKECKGDDSRCWFLPNHPVFNINKSSEVRVQCDCAAQCREE